MSDDVNVIPTSNGIDSGLAIEAKLESGELKPTPAGSIERAPLIDAMETAAIRLRDAELAVQQARDAYAQAINAFTRFVTGGQ